MPTFKENAEKYKAWALSRESRAGKMGAIALPFLPVAMVLGLAVDSSKSDPVVDPVPIVVATPTPTPSPTPAIAPTSTTAEPAKDLATQIAAEKYKKQAAEAEALKVAAMEEAIAQAEQERAADQALADEQAEQERIAEEQAQAAAAMDYAEPNGSGYADGSCAELRSAGFGSDFVPGDANYTDGRDRDGDGVACES